MASTLKVNNIVGATTPANVFISGHVIQHKFHAISNETDFSSISVTTYTDLAGSSFSFTPKQSGSKLLITMINHIYIEQPGGDWGAGVSRLVVDGNNQSHAGSDGLGYNVGIRDTDGAGGQTTRLMAYDMQEHEYTTTGTSAITIKAQGYKQSGSNFYFNKYGRGSIKVLEISQ